MSVSPYVATYEDIMRAIDAVDVVAYERTRNHLSGAVSRLSPYITRGVITLPYVRERILSRASATDARKYIQELAWREFFQLVWAERGSEIFTDLRHVDRSWRHHQVPEALLSATTGIPTIDNAIRELYDTGYVHNHARMWVAGLATNLAHAHWLTVSRWFYYHLIDGDIASNTLSFQWVAGTMTGKPYDFNEAIINACSPTPSGRTFLDIDRSALLTMETPAVLVPHRAPELPVLLPKGENIPMLAGRTVRLFHPFHLDPLWRNEEVTVDILVLDPVHFKQFPVSPAVINFIVAQARAVLPQVVVHVGSPHDLPGIATAKVYTRGHPTVLDWPAVLDPVPKLFPEVVGRFGSFSAFWRQCERYS